MANDGTSGRGLFGDNKRATAQQGIQRKTQRLMADIQAAFLIIDPAMIAQSPLRIKKKYLGRHACTECVRGGSELVAIHRQRVSGSLDIGAHSFDVLIRIGMESEKAYALSFEIAPQLTQPRSVAV